MISFSAERGACPCGGKLDLQKSRRKTVLSLTGPFIAHETLLQCRTCLTVYASDALRRLVPARCNIAYDVMVFVGHALFQRCLTIQEILAELIVRNVRISSSEVSHLGRKFISYLAVAHGRSTPRIHQAMMSAGGYVLHLDAMHESDTPALMSGMDSLSKIVLANVKIPTEHTDHIIPFLQKLRKDYGIPTAIVHDMGTGIGKAVAEVFPDVPDFICHFHFLRDIGKDLLEPAYRDLRNRLRHHAISTRLNVLARESRQAIKEQMANSALLAKSIQTAVVPENPDVLPQAMVYCLSLWILHGKHTGDGYGFPFDRPLLEFSERLLITGRCLSTCPGLTVNNRKQPLRKLARYIADIAEDQAFQKAVAELRWRSQIFDRLRDAMRIALPGGGNGLNDDGTTQDMATIRHSVTQFRCKIKNDSNLSADLLVQKMVAQLDKYGDKLFADPITVNRPNGILKVYPQRTNNIIEQFFRGLRRSQRRKTGNNTMRRALQTMLADTPLIKNLSNPEYMKILLNGKTDIADLFADLGEASIKTHMGLQTDTDRILPGFRALTKSPKLHEQVVKMFALMPQTVSSN